MTGTPMTESIIRIHQLKVRMIQRLTKKVVKASPTQVQVGRPVKQVMEILYYVTFACYKIITIYYTVHFEYFNDPQLASFCWIEPPIDPTFDPYEALENDPVIRNLTKNE
jgi:hypothetical protein